MKWLLLVLFITDFEPEQTHFATEEACMDAAEALVQTNLSFEWVDDPDRVEWLIRPVIRPSVECVDGDED
jgi:hypothetical protein